MIKIQPQPGRQTQFHATPADFAIYGGSAGSGKTYSLLIEPLRHLYNGEFRGVIFRKEVPMITAPGALLDTSMNIYLPIGGEPKLTTLDWNFKSGMRLKFSHMQHESDMYNWQGSQMAYVAFDEITHFTEKQVFYMFSRMRSVSGVPAYMRATCNPDPDSFVAKLINWYIDDDGFPIEERVGKLRWFIRQDDQIIWGNTKEELTQKYGDLQQPKSFTFIAASIYDNKILLKKDPQYISNLMALPKVERARLLGGNWKIRPDAGLYFKPSYFEFINPDQLPPRRQIVRYWDRASREAKEGTNPDWTVGVKMSRCEQGLFYVEHVERFQGSPLTVEQRIKNIASQDKREVTIGIEQDPGQAGVFEVDYYVRALAGYSVKLNKVNENKIVRAGPFSSQAEYGKVKIVHGAWNQAYLNELEAFPKGTHDDQVDASSGAFKILTSGLSDTFKEEFVEQGYRPKTISW